MTGEGAPHDTLRRAVQQQKPDIHKRLLQYVEELNAL